MVRFKRYIPLISGMGKIVEKNTSKVWDKLWEESTSEEKDRFSMEYQKKTILWKRIRERVIKEFGSFKGLKSIEVGAGEGIDSLLFAMEGADVTVLDYSANALKTSKILFKRFGYKAKFILMDALNLDKELFSKFDVSMSYGTAEHFLGKNRIKIFQSHLDVLKEGGITFISIPNKWNLPYRIYMFLSQTFGRWRFGEEYPFSISELKGIGRKIGCEFEIIGASLFFTHLQLKTRIRKLLGKLPNYDSSKLKEQIGTPIDKYLSYEIAVVGKKV